MSADIGDVIAAFIFGCMAGPCAVLAWVSFDEWRDRRRWRIAREKHEASERAKESGDGK